MTKWLQILKELGTMKREESIEHNRDEIIKKERKKERERGKDGDGDGIWI